MLPGGIPIPLNNGATPGQAGATYTDFSEFTRLRAAAKRDAAGTLEEVANQFESLFIAMMLKSMRETTHGDPMLGAGGKMFTDLFDQQLSLDLSSSQNFGLAEMLVRQLSQSASALGPATQGTPVVADLQQQPAVDSSKHHPQARIPSAAPPRAELAAARPLSTRAIGDKPAPAVREPIAGSPAEFVEQLWGHAQQAAKELGVDPKVLIAQAALETGWGRSVIQAQDGQSSYNLFGIKADRRWQGPRVDVSTLEFDDGMLTRVRAPFRAYNSLGESFADYARFVSTQPRYSEALANSADPRKYLQALQSAGYATDPNYASKIISIYERSEFSTLGDQAEANPNGI